MEILVYIFLKRLGHQKIIITHQYKRYKIRNRV